MGKKRALKKRHRKKREKQAQDDLFVGFSLAEDAKDKERRESLLAQIEAAFQDVPFVGPGHPSLYQAEAADNYEECDQSRDHKGSWQTIPLAHFLECSWALSYLDGKGLQYYLPALMSYWLADIPSKARSNWIFESLMYTFAIDRNSPTLYAYAKERFSILTIPQKQVILAFLRYERERCLAENDIPPKEQVIWDWEKLAAGEGWTLRNTVSNPPIHID